MANDLEILMQLQRCTCRHHFSKDQRKLTESSIKTELFACLAKEVNTSPLSSTPVQNILCMSDFIRRPVAVSTYRCGGECECDGEKMWHKIKIMSQT